MASKNSKTAPKSARKPLAKARGPVPKEQREARALRVIRKHPATPAEVAQALHLEGSWAPQMAVAALEKLVRSGAAKKRQTKDGDTVYEAA